MATDRGKERKGGAQMMDFKAISQALGQRLAAMPNVPPIVWGNKSADFPKPYLIARHQPVSRDNATLDNTIDDEQIGLFFVDVVVESDTFETQAEEIAWDVAQQFRKGLRLAATGGVVLIDAPAEPVAGFHSEGNEWRMPVRIRYRTESAICVNPWSAEFAEEFG